MIVLDTHVLAWADSDDRRLGRKSKALVNRHWKGGGVAVCAISFWEIALLQARGRIRIQTAVDEWRSQLLAAGLTELPVDGNIGIRAVELGGLPDDPADRLIVATALEHRAALVTGDDKLLAWDHPLARHDARA